MSSGALADGAAMFRQAIKRDEFRGCVLLVARRGTVVLHEAIGHRDKENGLPYQLSTLFRMASNTKPVVATAILQLAEQQKLGLDDPVHDYVPSFDTDQARAIQVRHLLSHTSGLRIDSIFLRPLSKPSAEFPAAPTLQSEVARYGPIGAKFPPGETYSYNNPGFNTLGAIVEKVSGQALKQYLRERIYQPLGMAESWNYEADAPQERMAVVYDYEHGKWRRHWEPGDGPDYPFPRASGGMISTTSDYARFCQMFLDGGDYGGTRILGEESVRAATQGHSPAFGRDGGESRYGYGWVVRSDGSFEHGGSDGTFASIDPGRELFYLVFSQFRRGRPNALRQQFGRAVRAAVADS